MLVIIDDSQSRDEIGHTAHRLCLPTCLVITQSEGAAVVLGYKPSLLQMQGQDPLGCLPT